MSSTVFIVPLVISGCAIAVGIAAALLTRTRASRVRARTAASPLAHELPYWQILDDGVLVGVDLTYSAGLIVEGLDTDCMSSEQLAQVDTHLHTLLQVLPAGVRLQWSHSTDHDQTRLLAQYRAGIAGENALARDLATAKMDAIAATPHLRRSRMHLFVSAPNAFQGAGAQMGYRKRWLQITERQHEEEHQRIRNIQTQVARGLSAAGLTARALGADDVRQLVYDVLNPTRCRTVPAPSQRSALPFSDMQTAREQLAFAGLREDVTTLHLDEQLVRVITLRDLPASTSSAFLEKLTVALPFSCRVQLAVETLDTDRALGQLKRSRDQANALARLGDKRNQEAEAKGRDVEDLIDANLNASIRMVRVGLSVVLSVADRAGAADELEHQTQEVLRLVAGLDGAQGLVETYCQLDAFLSTLPGNVHHQTRWHTCTSTNAAHLMLAWQSWPGTDQPAVLFENGRNYILGFTPFSPGFANPNAFMAGASGAGKSVTTNYLLMHLLATGAKGIVIDVGGSYRKLIGLAGGEYFDFDRRRDPALNLFYEPGDVRDEHGGLDPLRMQFMLTVLDTLLVEVGQTRLPNLERRVLDAGIRALYATAETAPILSDLVSWLGTARFPEDADTELARQLRRRLLYWTTGPHQRLLDRPSTVRLTADFAGFDLKDLPDEVRPAVLLILSSIIWNLVTKNRAEKKVVVFDEVWTLLSNDAGAKLIEELFRTSRKYNTAMLAISQHVDDFTGSPIAAALVNNSAMRYLLKHESGHDVIADTFGLNPREKFVFTNLQKRAGEYSELLLMAGKHRSLARVVLTPLEYWIATTSPPDQAALDLVSAALPHLPLLDRLKVCAERWPTGAPADLSPAHIRAA